MNVLRGTTTLSAVLGDVRRRRQGCGVDHMFTAASR